MPTWTRWISALAFLIVVTLALGCKPKPVPPPQPPPSAGWLKLLVVDPSSGGPIENARVDIQAIEGEDDGRTNGDGRKDLFIRHGVWALEVHADGYRCVQGCRDINFTPGAPDYTDGVVVHLEKLPTFTHPDPVIGRLRTIGNECFADDTGCRTFAIVHAGDLVARWMYGCREECLRDLDDMAAAGYHIVRSWWHLGVNHWPWNQGGSPPYPGVDVFETPSFVSQGVELALEVKKRGMRIAIGAGGIGRMSSAQERDMARVFRDVINLAGADAFAWAEGVNEPSSTHATSDNDGDNQPANLKALTDIMTSGNGLLYHGGYWNNNDYQDDAPHQLPGQTYNYVHGWRGGTVFNKIDRRFTWARIYAEETGRASLRLTIDGESVGWPVSGPPLRYVSATANGHEMNSAEALALTALGTAVRGIPSHMSGTGVQRYEPFANTVGFTEIPWAIRQLPLDVHTYSLIHGGQLGDSRLVIEATTNAHGVLGRADQAVRGSVVAALLYNLEPFHAQSYKFRKSFSGKVCDVGAMSCVPVEVPAGGRLETGVMQWGRLIVGIVQ